MSPIILLATAVLADPAAAEARTSPQIVGAVEDERGRPVAGATVFVSTAAPREGVGYL